MHNKTTSAAQKGRIIIDFDSMTEADAVDRVLQVICGGRVSQNKNGKHFCWVTSFRDDSIVYVRQKKKGQTSDSFHVTIFPLLHD